jgi:hypothetical protein
LSEEHRPISLLADHHRLRHVRFQFQLGDPILNLDAPGYVLE